MTGVPSARARPRLTVLNTHLAGTQVVLHGAAATIGRSAECDIRLDVASISRVHARVEEMDGHFFAADMGSRNGIRIGNQQVGRGELHDGNLLTVGQVQLRFEYPGAPAAQPPPDASSVGAAVAKPLTGTDVISAARATALAADAQGNGGEAKQRVGLNLRLVVLLVLAVTISAGLGLAMVRYLSRNSADAPKEFAPLLIRVGESKWVRIGGIGRFSQGAISVEEEGIVGVRKVRDAAEIVITGKSGGSTTVTIRGERRVGWFRALVRGRIEDPLVDLTYDRLTMPERLRVGREFVEAARLFEAENRPYRAMQEYRKAAAVLKPLEQGDLYREAKQGISGTGRTVDALWEQLSSDIGVALRNNNYRRARELIEEVLVLIPDTNDWRHQKVAAKKRQLLGEDTARAKRRGR